MLAINSLLDISLANIFSHFIGCLFICWLFLLLYRSFLAWGNHTYTCWLLLFILLCHISKNCCQKVFSLHFIREIFNHTEKLKKIYSEHWDAHLYTSLSSSMNLPYSWKHFSVSGRHLYNYPKHVGICTITRIQSLWFFTWFLLFK